MRAHGCEVSLVKSDAEGTIFHLELPASQGTPATAQHRH